VTSFPLQPAHLPPLWLVLRPTAAHAAASSVTTRAVEAGARLLAAPPDDVRVIMQLPRGNLETVAPRALVLAAIADGLQVRTCSCRWQTEPIRSESNTAGGQSAHTVHTYRSGPDRECFTPV